MKEGERRRHRKIAKRVERRRRERVRERERKRERESVCESKEIVRERKGWEREIEN